MNKSVHELHNELYKRNSSMVNELELEKENNFILSNKIKQKDNDIKGITIVLNRARRYPLFQEAKRDIQIENKEENDTCFKDCLTSYQEALLRQCKNYNKVSHKIQKRKKNKNKLKQEIKALKPTTSMK